jgi:uncharacterized protein DUF669
MAEFTDFQVALTEDFADVKPWDGDFELCPPGDYTLTVVNVEQDTNSNNNGYIKITFEVADGENQGKKVFQNYYLTAKSLGRLKQFMVAAGMSLGAFSAGEAMGATILGTVYHSEGQAKIDQQGNTLPARAFANVKNERAVETPKATPAKTPPISKAATPPATKPANGQGAPRRA